MQDNLFSDLSQILPYLAEIDRKIAHLHSIYSRLHQFDSIEFIDAFNVDGNKVVIEQKDLPFNLLQEVKILLKDAMDNLHNHAKSLEDLSNQ
jgi:Fe2+ or Zn2+ uptake regulation protein